MKKILTLVLAAFMSFTPALSAYAAGGEARHKNVITEDISAAAVLREEPSDIYETSANPYTALFEDFEDYSEIILGVTAKGEYIPVDEEEYYNYLYAKYCLSEEFYEEIKGYDEYKDITFDEYKELVYSAFGIESADGDKFSDYGMFIVLAYYSENENTDHCAAAAAGFKYVDEKLKSDLSADILGDEKIIIANFHQYGDVVSVSAGYYNKEKEIVKTADNELVNIYGAGYALIGSAAVPAETKSLYISVSDKDYEEYYRNYTENEYETSVFDYPGSSERSRDKEVPAVDLAKISEELPCLEKLYISDMIPVTGLESINEQSSISELSISIWNLEDENALKTVSELNIEKLHIRDLSSSYSKNTGISAKKIIKYISRSKAKELAIECGCDSDILKALYNIPKITELRIGSRFRDEAPDLKGIETLTNLKKLTVETSTGKPDKYDAVPNYAPLSGLKSLEELTIVGNNCLNFKSIGRIKSLKTLTVYGLKYDKKGEYGVSLSDFPKNTALENIYIDETHYTILSALSSMKNLKSATFGKHMYFYDGLEEVAGASSLEELTFEAGGINVKGISKLKNLKKLTFRSEGSSDIENLHEINECPKLKTLILDHEVNELFRCFNAEDIENNTSLEELYLKNIRFMHYNSLNTLTSLRKLSLISTDLTAEQINSLRDEMTWCEVEAVLYDKDKTENEFKTEDGGTLEYQSLSEPLETKYIDGIRIEVYPGNDDYWVNEIHIKNFGKKTLKNVTDFIEKNIITKDTEYIYIYYPEYDGNDEVIETFPVTEKGLDYENADMYLNVFGAPDDDYIDNYRFRIIPRGSEIRILIHYKTEAVKDKENKSETDTYENIKDQSSFEPLETKYIDGIRIEVCPLNDDYWVNEVHIKNFGKKTLKNVTDFIEKNIITKDTERIYIYYPEYDGNDEVIEMFPVTEKGLDYENAEMYLSVLCVPNDDYIDNYKFRILPPGSEIRILIHYKTEAVKDKESKSETEIREDTKNQSTSEPLKTVYIDGIRIETYPDGDYYIKNSGKKTLKNVPEFIEKNILTETKDAEEIWVYYHPDDENAAIEEVFPVTDKGLDYENSYIMLSNDDTWGIDYIDNYEFRNLAPDREVAVLIF